MLENSCHLQTPIPVWGAWQFSPAVPKAPLWPAPSSLSFNTELCSYQEKKSCFSRFLANVWSNFRGRLGRGLAVALAQLAATIGAGAHTGTLLLALVPTGQSLSRPGQHSQTSQTLPESLSISFIFLSSEQKCLEVGPGLFAEVAAPGV